MNISDENLLHLCEKYGAQARIWRQKFCGLLPEVNKRQLYKKKNFHSIFEFAFKLAGLSEEQVRRVLNLEKKFEDKPILKSLLTNGEVSINKLAKIASVANAENQEFLAEQVQLLPCRSVEAIVRDMSYEKINQQSENSHNQEQNLLFHETKITDKSVHVNTYSHQLFDDVKLLQKFSLELKTKLHELIQKGINIDELLIEFLEEREEKIEDEKQNILTLQGKSDSSKPASRYIPIKIRKIITKEHGTKCSISSCAKQSQQLHHTQRFGLTKTATPNTVHDPHYLAPLCKEHHQIAHSIDVKFYEVLKTRN